MGGRAFVVLLLSGLAWLIPGGAGAQPRTQEQQEQRWERRQMLDARAAASDQAFLEQVRARVLNAEVTREDIVVLTETADDYWERHDYVTAFRIYTVAGLAYAYTTWPKDEQFGYLRYRAGVSVRRHCRREPEYCGDITLVGADQRELDVSRMALGFISVALKYLPDAVRAEAIAECLMAREEYRAAVRALAVLPPGGTHRLGADEFACGE
jgi:hypothetical protein